MFVCLPSWPEFIMLLEKGSNLTPEQIKTPTKKPPSVVYKPQLSQKKPLSPKASLHLPSNDTKPKAGTKPRPKSTNAPGKDSKSKETVDNSTEKLLDAQDASSGNVPEVKDNLKDAAVSKQSAGSKVKSKESPVNAKMAQKVKKDEGLLMKPYICSKQVLLIFLFENFLSVCKLITTRVLLSF